MSKSLGNVVEPQDLIAKYGADILRLWVSSLDYRDDMPISEEILARCAEAYRKIRNTARYLISNLYDFDPATDAVPAGPPAAARPLGASRDAESCRRRVRAAYERYEFHVVYHALVDFCADDALGVLPRHPQGPALRLAGRARRERRSAQTALHRIARALATLAAPILPFTAEEIWEALPGKKEESVHLARFETPGRRARGHSVPAEAWERLTQLREEAAVMLEEARREKTIGSSLEGAIVLTPTPDLDARPGRDGNGRSGPRRPLHRVRDRRGRDADGRRLDANRSAYPGLRLAFRKASGRRCDRCWKVTPEAEDEGLCDRCRGVLGRRRVRRTRA